MEILKKDPVTKHVIEFTTSKLVSPTLVAFAEAKWKELKEKNNATEPVNYYFELEHIGLAYIVIAHFKLLKHWHILDIKEYIDHYSDREMSKRGTYIKLD